MTTVARYLYKLGIVVTDDVVQKATEEQGALPLDGALVVRLNSPVRCLFISFGLGGISLPDSGGLCIVGDAWNSVEKEERVALGNLMRVLDPGFKLSLRMQWFLVDLKEANGVVLSNPTDKDIAVMVTAVSSRKNADRDSHKLAARIARRRSTAGADVPDGHEDDSDVDSFHRMLAELDEREKRADAARKKQLGSFPDTPIGRVMAKKFHPNRFPSSSSQQLSGGKRKKKSSSSKALIIRPASSEMEQGTGKEDDVSGAEAPSVSSRMIACASAAGSAAMTVSRLPDVPAVSLVSDDVGGGRDEKKKKKRGRKQKTERPPKRPRRISPAMQPPAPQCCKPVGVATSSDRTEKLLPATTLLKKSCCSLEDGNENLFGDEDDEDDYETYKDVADEEEDVLSDRDDGLLLSE